MGLINWARGFFGGRDRLAGEILEREFGAAAAASPLDAKNRRLWWDMYVNHPPWENCEVRPLGLPGAVGRELARQTLTEFRLSLSGGERAAFLNRQMLAAEKNFLRCLELGLCLGGIALKPCLENGRLLVDVSDFTPTRFDGEGRAIGGAFRSAPVQEGKQWFVRLEFHDFPPDRDGMYVIRNKAFYCSPDGFPGQPAPLECVPEWAGLAPETVIQGLQGPLFACFKPPEANAEEPGSRLGASVYAGAAAELIRQADEQWRMIRWEYESGKRRIYVDGVDAGQFNDEIFVVGPFSIDGNCFDVFSPGRSPLRGLPENFTENRIPGGPGLRDYLRPPERGENRYRSPRRKTQAVCGRARYPEGFPVYAGRPAACHGRLVRSGRTGPGRGLRR